MSSGGITKSKLCRYGATTFFIIAILCAVQSWSTGAPFQALALVSLVLGFICAVGIFTLGLPKGGDRNDAEWLDSIK